MSHRALLAAAGAQAKTYVEDVFSAYPFTGTGANQAINNGIDLTKGGLVWEKTRQSGSYSHYLVDTVRGGNWILSSSTSSADINSGNPYLTALANGYQTGALDSGWNASGTTYASWTFRRAPKFFDTVTWTGDGTSNRQIPHALGIAPGMVTAKRRDSTGDWAVWHRSATGDLFLDTTAAQTASLTQITAASATTFSVSSNANILNATYVAYAWAHDPDTVNGIVQCGTFTGSASDVQITLGWEPQYILVKDAPASSSWIVVDTSRGFSNSGYANLTPNSSAAETTVSIAYFVPNATGLTIKGGAFPAGDTVIYLAIRRGPMRTPTSGASVYNAIARTPNGSAVSVTGAGFAPDFLLAKVRTGTSIGFVIDRLRGRSQVLQTSATNSEPVASTSTQDVTSFDPNGASFGTPTNTGLNNNATPEIDWFLSRAPGFFDIVCYKGVNTTQTLAHNLGAIPGMIWFKNRSNAGLGWAVYHVMLGAGNELTLNTSAATVADSLLLNNTAPTMSGFTVGGSGYNNNGGDNFVAYLFGALPGVSSIGSYTGNGATQTINCGFASGARFVLIKRTDAAGDWIVLDTVRGIIVGNDPYLLLDSTAAEVTTADLLTPQAAGFGLTSNALVNASGGTFIYFAVA